MKKNMNCAKCGQVVVYSVDENRRPEWDSTVYWDYNKPYCAECHDTVVSCPTCGLSPSQQSCGYNKTCCPDCGTECGLQSGCRVCNGFRAAFPIMETRRFRSGGLVSIKSI